MEAILTREARPTDAPAVCEYVGEIIVEALPVLVNGHAVDSILTARLWPKKDPPYRLITARRVGRKEKSRYEEAKRISL